MMVPEIGILIAAAVVGFVFFRLSVYFIPCVHKLTNVYVCTKGK